MSQLQKGQKQLLVNTVNKYDFYEYEKPLMFNETDYRSGATRSHRYYFPKDVPKEPEFKCNTGKLMGSNPICIKNVSETTEKFPFKFPLKYEPRAADLTYQSNRPSFIKYFDEKVKKTLVRPINEYQTRNSHEYTSKSLAREPNFQQTTLNYHIEHPNLTVYSNEKGKLKYLDPFVSTTNLNHIYFTEEMQKGIAKKDAITFWDWLQYPKTKLGFGLKEYPYKDCKKILPMYDKSKFLHEIKDRELPKRMKFVPNNSFKTESRINYQIPVEKVFLYDKSHGKPIVYETGIEIKDTEYKMIGSGKPIQSYLQVEKPKIVHKKSGDCR
uniref:CSON009834 protein n=1 Tax=Culicoides sonorensis TaxID=179676 RepID=A0A336M112_CULSO